MSEKWLGQSIDPSQEQLEQTSKLGGSSESLTDEVGDLNKDELTESARSHAKQEIGEVDEQDWQKRINAAFQQDDFKLIKLLQRVRPELLPDQSIVQARISELITSRLNKWAESIREIRAVSHVELDQTLVASEYGKLLDRLGRAGGNFDELKEFMQVTGFNPDTKTVQAKYRDLLTGRGCYYYNVEDLTEDIKNLTGIRPEKQIFEDVLASGDIVQAKKIAKYFGAIITSDMVQKAYEFQFQKKGCIEGQVIQEIGEKPNPILLAKMYQKFIDNHDYNGYWTRAIEDLENITGVKPNFTSEQLKPVFEDYLSKGWFGREGYVGIEHVIERIGVRPSVDLVQKYALGIIDGGLQYANASQGKEISEGIARLKESTGVEFDIPEGEIQERYQKAIAERKPYALVNLYNAFGVRPSIGSEEARQFILYFIDETYHNPNIKELENLFGIEFKATEEEIEAKQEQDIEKLNFDGLAKITELTGKDCDAKKLEARIIKWLEKEAAVTSENRKDYNRDWEKPIKQCLEQFNITIPAEVAVNIYTSLIRDETAYSSNLVKTCQLTGVPIPAELAQQAYRKYLSSGYAYSIKTGQGSSRGLGSVSGAFEELFKASGIRPEITSDDLQSFYRSSLEGDSGYSIAKVAEIAGIKPEFNPQDVNCLYKEWILSGREGRVRNVKEITGIELQLDEEITAFVSQQIEAGIEKVRSTDYEKEEYREKKFDTYSLEQDLRKVSSLATATGIKPNFEKLQSAYSEILSVDPYWDAKIEQIIKATNIKPEFDPQLIQSKGEQLLARGALRSLQHLQEFGDFTFLPEMTEKAYDTLIEANHQYDDYGRQQYYERDWLSGIQRLHELSQIQPTEQQWSAILGHILNDKQYTGRSYDKIGTILDLMEKELGVVPSETILQGLGRELFASNDWEHLANLKKRMGHPPEIPLEVVQAKNDELLREHDFKTLETVRAILDLEIILLTPEVVQDEYSRLIEEYATHGDRDVETFYKLHELTRIKPELSEEQISLAYRRILFQGYGEGCEKFEQVVGVPPKESDLQDYIYNCLIGNYLQRDIVVNFIKKYHVVVSPEIASKAAICLLKKTKMKQFNDTMETIEFIERSSGSKVRIEPQTAIDLTRRILETHGSTGYNCDELSSLFSWFEKITGQKPSQELVDIAYTKTLNQTVSHEKNSDGQYLKAWDWLKQGYGMPSSRAVQLIYLAELMK